MGCTGPSDHIFADGFAQAASSIVAIHPIESLIMSNASDKIAITPPAVDVVGQKAREESWKLRYDTYKHLTTLSTGSILLLVTFLEKLFTKPQWKWLVIASFCSFVVTTLASLIVMNTLAGFIREMELKKNDEILGNVYVVIALASFLLGITSLIIFAVKNLY